MGETNTGHIQWGDWFFDYGVFGSEGLSLVDGHFRGYKMFNKLSLPVIRVKYVVDESGFSALVGTGCGPYNDQIIWDTDDFGENLNPIAGPHHLVKIVCSDGNRYICREEITLGGLPHLRLGVYARIGAYHIAQTWTLNNEGEVLPRVFSKGLSCTLDHWHHPYWRFDFALGSPERNRVSVVSESSTADIAVEGAVVNAWFGHNTQYRVTSTQPPDVGDIELPARATIVPPVIGPPTVALYDGIVGPTSFSSRDGYIRKFRPEEDRPWPHAPANDIGFAVHEPCVDSEIVFWSICHLFHRAEEGEDHWHSVGPNLHFRPMILANVPSEYFRVVEISGVVNVMDFKAVGKNLFHKLEFTDKVLVNPSAKTGEVVRYASVGDTKAELIVRINWNKDSSVNVQFTANLFDGLERVAAVKNQFNVLRDNFIDWSGIHLVDHHRGDPDTADMSFTVRNS